MILTNLRILPKKTFNSDFGKYCFSFLLPAGAFFAFFAVNQFNILTVDLGQQYVDFLTFFKRNILTNPLAFIYSFQNGLGNSMLATSAYYLLSPFNLLLLFFKKSQLPIAILIIICLKIGASGLSSYYCWHNKFHSIYALSASIAYSLSGYIIANHFNLMWLDTIILLPLLIQAIDQTIQKAKDHLIFITFLIWITNFYTGLMALFFGFLYFFTQFLLLDKTKQKHAIKDYLTKSILGTFLASFILIPVFFELLAGKATTQVNWSLSWQFSPDQELAKLADGAYNFHEMQTGLPNIFLTMPFLLLTISYFLAKRASLKEKLINGSLMIFLLLSLSFTPFVLIWHLGQFPVWYPGRFSFVLIFYCLHLSLIFLNKEKNISWKHKIILTFLSLCLISYWYYFKNYFSFFNQTNLIISSLFIFLALLFILLLSHPLNAYFLLTIIIFETIINMILSLNNLSYQKNTDYQNFASNTNQVTNYIIKNDSTLTRTEKSFYRSDDDPFTANYNGISNFNSISNQSTLNFLANLGYLHNSNSYTNTGGTLLTDSLLGIKYYIKPNYNRNNIKINKLLPFNNLNQRPDLSHYLLQIQFKQLLLVKNLTALPLVFISKLTNPAFNFKSNEPINNQNLLLQKIIHKKIDLFHKISWPNPVLLGAQKPTFNPAMHYQQKKGQQHQINFTIHTKKNNTYYLKLPADFNQNKADLYVNHHQINLNVRNDQNHLINLGNYYNKKIIINFNLKQKELNLDNIQLFSFDIKQLDEILLNFKKNQPKIKQQTPLLLKTNTFTTKQTKSLLTTIPASKNWIILDQGKKLTVKPFASTFLSAKLKGKGKHQITFVYIPWEFLFGIFISFLTLIYFKFLSN